MWGRALSCRRITHRVSNPLFCRLLNNVVVLLLWHCLKVKLTRQSDRTRELTAEIGYVPLTFHSMFSMFSLRRSRKHMAVTVITENNINPQTTTTRQALLNPPYWMLTADCVGLIDSRKMLADKWVCLNRPLLTPQASSTLATIVFDYRSPVWTGLHISYTFIGNAVPASLLLGTKFSVRFANISVGI